MDRSNSEVNAIGLYSYGIGHKIGGIFTCFSAGGKLKSLSVPGTNNFFRKIHFSLAQRFTIVRTCILHGVQSLSYSHQTNAFASRKKESGFALRKGRLHFTG